MKQLTERQLEVLRTIADFRARRQMSPTLRDLGDALDISSTNSVTDHLKALEVKGYITRNRKLARALFLTREGLLAVSE